MALYKKILFSLSYWAVAMHDSIVAAPDFKLHFQPGIYSLFLYGMCTH